MGEDWNVSSVQHYSSSKKKEKWNVFGVVCLRTLKAHLN
jgi:hypothetical protein